MPFSLLRFSLRHRPRSVSGSNPPSSIVNRAVSRLGCGSSPVLLTATAITRRRQESEEEVSARAHARAGAADGGIAQSDLIAHSHVASGIEINWNASLTRRRHDRLGDLDTARSLRQGDDARGNAVANTRTE